MPVYGSGGLLDTHTSHELTEWMAYERVAGPLGDGWRLEMLAQMHELTQATNYLLGAQFTDDNTPNPVAQPKPVPRPWAVQDDEKGEED